MKKTINYLQQNNKNFFFTKLFLILTLYIGIITLIFKPNISFFFLILIK